MQINEDGLADYAAGLPLDQVLAPALDPQSHFLGRGKDTALFFLVLDAVNFGSGYFPHLAKLPGKSGYFTVATRLTEWFGRQLPTAAQLSQLTPADCGRIFGQNPADPVIGELMGLFAKALNDLGQLLIDRFNGHCASLIEAAGHSAASLVEILAAMPLFADVQAYQGVSVPFFKRAQLTAADLSLAFNSQGPGRFDDIDRLTIFADNLVPHVLRADGILHYEEALAQRIDQGGLIDPGSDPEIEIRACALHAVERLCDHFIRAGHPVTARQLDYLLWNRGQQPYYKARPRHRCRTWFY